MKKTRLIPAAGGFLLLLAAFFGVLWNLQVVKGQAYYDRAQRSVVQVETVPAARGKLLDRTGKILAQDETLWTATVSDSCDAAAKTRFRTLCREEDIHWVEDGPIQPVTSRLMARVTEENLEGIGFTPTVRRAVDGSAPHLLGRVAAMSQEEWKVYQTQGYALNETVGKDGAEAAFEGYLHGVPGQKLRELDRAGNLIAERYATDPVPGKNVTLTLDKAVQTAADEALADFLADHPTAKGGAVVALSVADGGVLAMTSQPDYDPATFSADYTALSKDPAHPLLNRALQGLYAPGSTFKLVTAAAALEEGILTPETEILDTGRYTYYPTPQPQCWLYREEGRTHGRETVAQAITDSCNVFFYDAGRRVGIERLDAYARALGLGRPTGIELAGEETGAVAGPAYTRSIGGTWYEGSVLSAAIGQENNRFTPLQLAHMTATVVSGERRQVHLLKEVAGEEPYQPLRLDTLSLSPETRAAIKEGMLAVTQSGSLAAAFSALPVQAGAKTGSAQVAGEEEANGVLVCFAPYEDPEIAVAIVVEQGGSGSALGEVAARVLEAYFQPQIPLPVDNFPEN